MAEGSRGRDDQLARHPAGVYLAGKIGLTFLVLVASALVAVQNPQGAYAPRSAFYIVGVAFLVWGASAAGLRLARDLVRFGWFQLVFDAVLVTALVALTTGVDSPLVVLYFINIIAAPFLLPWWGVVSVLALDGLGFVAVAVAGRAGLFPWLADSHALLALDDVVLHVFAMALVGMLSVQLTRTMKGLLDRQVRAGEALVADQAMIMAELDVGLVELGADGEVTAVNPVAERHLGDVRGLPVAQVLPGEGPTWEVVLDQAGDAVHLLCTRRRRAAGDEMILLQDVTQLRAMEAVIERDERLAAVGKLAASIAHEIRNPLASLSGSIQLMQEEQPDPLHEIALREVQRLDQLVDEFLDTARPPELRKAVTDLVSLVEEVARAFRNDRRYAERVTVEVQVEGPVPLLTLDAARVRQVVWNLLLNAAQAMSGQGSITVRIRPRARSVELGVVDTGVGMSPDKLRRIFDPFFTTRSGGTGLGLANVERIVRGHGGTISVYSKPGQGTAFMICLPMDPLAEGEVEPGYDRSSPTEVIEVDG